MRTRTESVCEVSRTNTKQKAWAADDDDVETIFDGMPSPVRTYDMGR